MDEVNIIINYWIIIDIENIEEDGETFSERDKEDEIKSLPGEYMLYKAKPNYQGSFYFTDIAK